MTEKDTLAVYEKFKRETGDSQVASHLTLAHAILCQIERAHEMGWTVEEAARYLKLSTKKVYQLCHSGELGYHLVGQSIRITPDDVYALIRKSKEDLQAARKPKIEAKGNRYAHLISGYKG